MTSGIVGNLYVADPRQVCFQEVGQVTFHPLGMINVVLEVGVGVPDFIEHFEHVLSRVQRKAGNIFRVEMFNQKPGY